LRFSRFISYSTALFIEHVCCRKLKKFRANKSHIILSLKYSYSRGKDFLARQRKRTWNRTFDAKHEIAWENILATYKYTKNVNIYIYIYIYINMYIYIYIDIYNFFLYFAAQFRNSGLWFMGIFRSRVSQLLWIDKPIATGCIILSIRIQPNHSEKKNSNLQGLNFRFIPEFLKNKWQNYISPLSSRDCISRFIRYMFSIIREVMQLYANPLHNFLPQGGALDPAQCVWRNCRRIGNRGLGNEK